MQQPRTAKRLQVVAVGWVCYCYSVMIWVGSCTQITACVRGFLYVQDPEGILRAPQGDHISRRTMSKQVEDNKEMQADLAKREAELKAEMDQSRQVRLLPTTVMLASVVLLD